MQKNLEFHCGILYVLKAWHLYVMEKIKYIDVQHAIFYGFHDVIYMTID
jgi:hypothetical protein